VRNETPTEKWGFFYFQEFPAAGSSIRKLVWQPPIYKIVIHPCQPIFDRVHLPSEKKVENKFGVLENVFYICINKTEEL